MKSSRAFAASEWKLPVVGILALGCVGFFLYQAIPSRSERTDKPKPSLVRADGTTPEPRQARLDAREMNWESAAEDEGREYAFERVRNASDVSAQMGTMAQVVSVLNDETPDQSDGLGARIADFLEPINAGDKESLDQAVTRLGGTLVADEDGDLPTDGIYTLFAGLLKFASLDTTNIQVREPTQSVAGQEGIRVNMNRNVDSNPDTGEEVETVSSVMTGAPSTLFPLAALEDAQGKLVEVCLPFLSNGNKSDRPDVVVNLQMRNVAGAGWQPAGFIVDVRNEELMQKVMQEVTSRRGG